MKKISILLLILVLLVACQPGDTEKKETSENTTTTTTATNEPSPNNGADTPEKPEGTKLVPIGNEYMGYLDLPEGSKIGKDEMAFGGDEGKYQIEIPNSTSIIRVSVEPLPASFAKAYDEAHVLIPSNEAEKAKKNFWLADDLYMYRVASESGLKETTFIVYKLHGDYVVTFRFTINGISMDPNVTEIDAEKVIATYRLKKDDPIPEKQEIKNGPLEIRYTDAGFLALPHTWGYDQEKKQFFNEEDPTTIFIEPYEFKGTLDEYTDDFRAHLEKNNAKIEKEEKLKLRDVDAMVFKGTGTKSHFSYYFYSLDGKIWFHWYFVSDSRENVDKWGQYFEKNLKNPDLFVDIPLE